MAKFHRQRLKKEIGNQICRKSRKKIYINFTSFAEAVEASELNKIQFIELDFENTGSEKQEDKMVTLEDIVRLTTVSKFVIHSMLETGTIEFIHKEGV